jgi:hypothetical protein
MSDQSASVTIHVPDSSSDVEVNDDPEKAQRYQPLTSEEMATKTNGRKSLAEKLKGVTYPVA